MKKINIILLLFLFFQIIFGQERMIHGIVKGSIGVIPGANVRVEQTNRSTQTDFDGKYSIKATSDEVLIFSFTGHNDSRVKATEIEINVILKEGIRLIEVIGPAYYPQRQSKLQTSIISIKKLTSISNPKQYFKSNAKNNIYIIYVTNLSSLAQRDFDFQKKYNITYSLFNLDYSRYFKRYNKHTFKYLNKKYKKKWQTAIRKDAFGLEEFLN